MTPYRILSLDGGGSWALLQVIALQKIYGTHAGGHDIFEKFDLVAANSGGSITLAGLLTGKTLDEIRQFFVPRRQGARYSRRFRGRWIQRASHSARSGMS